MVNRKLKKKTLKKKSKNKTKKKYMNRRDIENLFMVSSFQRGGVDLHGGGPKVLERVAEQIAPNPIPVQVKNTQPEQRPDWLTGALNPKPSSMGLPKFVNKNTTLGSSEQPSAPHPTSTTSSYPLMTHLDSTEQPITQEPSLSSISSEQSIQSEQPARGFTTYIPSIEEAEGPPAGQETDEDTDEDEETDDGQETDCNTLLQELTNILENIIIQFNSL